MSQSFFQTFLYTNILIFPSSVSGTPHDLRCKVHMGEKLQLYCETCEVLTCKDCQLSEKHSGHKHRENHEVVPDVKIALNQAVSDVRLKRNVLNEGQAHHMFSRFLNLRIYFNEKKNVLFFYKVEVFYFDQKCQFGILLP